MSTPPITGVTGGSAGLAARYSAVLGLADQLSAAAGRLLEQAADDLRVLAEPDLVESALLSPVSFAEAEVRVLDAASGVHGALEASALLESDAVLVRATLAAYQECDRAVATSLGVLGYAIGRAAGSAVRGLAPALVPLVVAVDPAARALPARVRERLGDTIDGSAQGWVEDHPGSVQLAVDGVGGLVDGLLGLPPLHPTVAVTASDLAAFYPPETDPAVRRRRDLATPLGSTPPDDLAALLGHLQQTGDLSTPDRPDDQGTIEIQTLHAPDGSVRHIVYLPGTDDLTTSPWRHDSDVRDLPADLRLIAGEPTAYAAGIERAMSHAGVGHHDPVLLVGHSLGGMEAATMLAHGSGFDVTHVVTAGAPIAGVHPYPDSTHVLSLENRGDVVPLLDGQDNPDSVQQVTVQFDDPDTSVVADHGLAHYVRGAAAADASTDPSVREQLASLRARGFLGERGRATSQVFQIVR